MSLSMRRLCVFSCAVSALLSALNWTTPTAQAGPAVLPPHSTVAGKTLGEWGSVWWQRNYAATRDNSPLWDKTGANAAFGDVGDVFLLFGQSPVPPNPNTATERTVTVPAGKHIFFPIANFEFDPIGFLRPPTEAELVQVINDYIDTTTDLSASVNGAAVPDLFSHREVSPATFDITLPENNIYVTSSDEETGEPLTFADPGTYGPAIQGGYYLMLTPLQPGEQLELKWTAAADGTLTIPAGIADANEVTFPVQFTQDVTYHVTAAGATPIPLPAAALLGLGVLPLAAFSARRAKRSLTAGC